MVRLIVIVVALAGASPLFAQDGADLPQMVLPPPGAAFQALKENLGLTDFQLEQLLQILKEKNEALQQRYRQISQKEIELSNLLNSGSQDVNRIGMLTLEIHTLRTQPPPSNDPYRQRALAVLTVDQKAKLAMLEQALKLSAPAYQAVTLNLIGYPQPVQILAVPGVPPVAVGVGTSMLQSQ